MFSRSSRAFFAILVIVAATAFCTAAEIPIGIDALSDINSLPLLRSGTWTTCTDSHDVTGRNNDGFFSTFSYLYKDGDEYVLFEDKGPGCVYEIRTIEFKGNFNIYLDGSNQPQHTISLSDMYSGKNPPFVRPLVGSEHTDHGCSWSYVPITYAKGCKITIDLMQAPDFFNIFAHKFASGTTVETGIADASLDKAVKLWTNPENAVKAEPDFEKISNSITVLPRETVTIADVNGRGAIKRLRIKFPEGSTDLAADLTLRAYWDGKVTPQVNSPMSTFFAMGCPRAIKAKNFQRPSPTEGKTHKTGVTKTKSIFVGQADDGWLYCNFPMPFGKSARIEILNTSRTQPIKFEYEIDYSPKPYPLKSGYFYAQWRSESPLRPSEDYCVLDTVGQGHYVGCVLTFSTVDRDSPYKKNFNRGHLEGDSRFYVDDIRTPIFAGTGTEEYFNWGWYDIIKHDSTFSYPTHGYPLHLIDDQDHSVMYRFHISDIVPYYRSFKFLLEHGGEGRDLASYSGTVFYYQQDTPALILTDELDIGNAQSETNHNYKYQGAAKTFQRTLTYEDSYQLPIYIDSPRDRIHTAEDTGNHWSGSSEFTVNIKPENAGVKLRRRSYYGIDTKEDMVTLIRKKPIFTLPQTVEVKIDGQPAGDWSLPVAHARDTWRDTDFEIPARLTSGKDKITITLSSKNQTRWDEYTYWVYSYLK